MILRLLNMGFRKVKDNVYAAEDLVVEVRGDLIYIVHMNGEVTIDELEKLILAD